MLFSGGGSSISQILLAKVTMGTGLWNISVIEIRQYNLSSFWTTSNGQNNNASICYSDNTNTNVLVAVSDTNSSIAGRWISYYKYNITGPPSYWTNQISTSIPDHSGSTSGNIGGILINLSSNTNIINVWLLEAPKNAYWQINTWASQGDPETSSIIHGNRALFGGTAIYNGLTTYNAQAHFNYPVLHSFTYNNNFQVMTVTGQINTNVNQVISIGAITLTLPNATNAKIGQIISIHLGPNTATARYPTIIIPTGSGMKMCIGQNTGGVTTYTFVAATLSLRLLYIGSYTVNSVTSLFWVAV
jgi:hypothetical protein